MYMNWGMIFVILVMSVSFSAAHITFDPHQENVMHDISRLDYTEVYDIVTHEEISQMQDAIKKADEQDLKISIAGTRHSMGGHTFFEEALVLDMTDFDTIIAVDPERKIVRAQSGARWDEVIREIDQYNLSVTVMQAYSGFSLGGSASVNVHESDPRYGPMIETIESFRLLLANGTLLEVSREENAELFGLVIGGYGLFGVITDIDLRLTDNKLYEKSEFTTTADVYLQEYRKLQEDPAVENVFARLDFSRGDGFLRDVIVTVYSATDQQAPELFALQDGTSSWRKKFFFDVSRSFGWGKELRWYLQSRHSNLVEPDLITRNNLDLNGLDFLEYYSETDTDILQEYFVPVEAMPAFLEHLREVVIDNDINLLSATIRWLPENTESMLSYSPQESFGVVLYFNIGTSDTHQERVTEWTRNLTDKALELNGTYYLPYVKYATQEQIRAAYPNIDEFFEKKRQYDPQERFYNKFYDYYAYPEQEI